MNLGAANDSIADRIPDREAIVSGARRVLWRELAERSRRLGNVLRSVGLGCHRERPGLRGWESGQSHVGVYLLNRPEYLEAMLGCFKARAAPFNVNYRYVAVELVELLRAARARALIFQGRFAPAIEAARGQLPDLSLLLQVADDSGAPLVPGALDYEAAISAAPPDRHEDLSPDDLYLLFTGGTTGRSKGVLWRQADVFAAALYDGSPPRSLRQLAVRAEQGDLRALCAAPMMHGGAQWAAFRTLHRGGCVVMHEDPVRFDPADILTSASRERVRTLLVIGDAMARPLIEELERHPVDTSHLAVLASGGAELSAGVKEAWFRRLPQLVIVDGLGSSESGNLAVQITRAGAASERSMRFRALGSETVVLSEDRTRVSSDPDGSVGWLARRGPIPLGYLDDPDATHATFPEIDGVRYVVPGDRAVLLSAGHLELLGRDATTINSGGEKVFSEEVEGVLKQHGAVYDAAVVGVASVRWGEEVTALVQLASDANVAEGELRSFAAGRLARYKVPRRIILVPTIPRLPTGKLDYQTLRRAASGACRP